MKEILFYYVKIRQKMCEKPVKSQTVLSCNVKKCRNRRI